MLFHSKHFEIEKIFYGTWIFIAWNGDEYREKRNEKRREYKEEWDDDNLIDKYKECYIHIKIKYNILYTNWLKV